MDPALRKIIARLITELHDRIDRLTLRVWELEVLARAAAAAAPEARPSDTSPPTDADTALRDGES